MSEPTSTGVVDLPASYRPATTGERFGGYLIDVLPVVVMSAILSATLTALPLQTRTWPGALAIAAYFLLRDVSGAGLGKTMLRMRIVDREGRPATLGARVLRNAVFAFGILVNRMPLGGAQHVISLIATVDALMIFGGGRLGDKLAGTTVVRQDRR